MFESPRPLLQPLGFGIDFNEALQSVVFLEREFSPYRVQNSLVQLMLLSNKPTSMLNAVIPPGTSADGQVTISRFTGMTYGQKLRFIERECLNQLDYWRRWDSDGDPVDPEQEDVLTLSDIHKALDNLDIAFKIFEPNSEPVFTSFSESIPWRAPYLLSTPTQVELDI